MLIAAGIGAGGVYDVSIGGNMDNLERARLCPETPRNPYPNNSTAFFAMRSP